MTPMRASLDLNDEIAAISRLNRDKLAVRWAKIYGCRPPVGVRRELLAYAVAWSAQAKRLGGHSTSTKKAIRHAMARVSRPASLSADKGDEVPLAEETPIARRGGPALETRPDTTPALSRRTVPQAGARLIREWNGKTNVVDVFEKGFQYKGETYGSLSAIARKITGAHWSGPRFFGL